MLILRITLLTIGTIRLSLGLLFLMPHSLARLLHQLSSRHTPLLQQVVLQRLLLLMHMRLTMRLGNSCNSQAMSRVGLPLPSHLPFTMPPTPRPVPLRLLVRIIRPLHPILLQTALLLSYNPVLLPYSHQLCKCTLLCRMHMLRA